ncbi:hypothetical protein BCR34DRAFT_639525 [Clohesyomyces aquaticus]|uniref:Uncharacterized protein n=1 Tax=Clohesyomyces aquaticus TaxID=1231657 RepID=A0A1Y2AAC9_9PLEO|nr:hypothetical protein BCR34DRAFT_639525 [Clohesyomyces aquaticus]
MKTSRPSNAPAKNPHAQKRRSKSKPQPISSCDDHVEDLAHRKALHDRSIVGPSLDDSPSVNREGRRQSVVDGKSWVFTKGNIAQNSEEAKDADGDNRNGESSKGKGAGEKKTSSGKKSGVADHGATPAVGTGSKLHRTLQNQRDKKDGQKRGGDGTS